MVSTHTKTGVAIAIVVVCVVAVLVQTNPDVVIDPARHRPGGQIGEIPKRGCGSDVATISCRQQSANAGS